MLKKFIVDKDYHNSRFDKWFKQNVFNIPQSLIEKIIRKNKVKVNKKKTKTSYRVQFHDIIEIYGINKIKSNDKSKKIKYKPSEKEKSKYDNFILENNNNFIIINKPSGIPVQAGTRSFKNIIDILKNTKYFKDAKPFIVHRLDKETSGVLIVAKNREYAQLFTSLFRIRKIHKTYLAITYGEVPENINLLQDDLISYDNNKKVIQKAISHLKILKSNGQYSLLELNPITGRKHQLRKQLYNIGNPIIGDDKYFVKKHINKIRSKNLMLHAHKIKFMINNVKYNFKAKYNEEFEDFIKRKF
ncbi:MAG: RNA pseudouridine synthase [Pelagibacteraceae bacterium]|nr:RNA pseudouridine synthase [Pelagibacteraceae bacterium]